MMKHFNSARITLPYNIKYFLIFCFGTLFLGNRCFSQRVTIIELINKTRCSEFSCFNDFITAKGFCYELTDKTNPDFTYYKFASCDYIEDRPSGRMIKNVVLLTLAGSTVIADIGTSSNKYYQLLIGEISKLGFKSYSVNDSEKTKVYVQYRSARYPKINLLVASVLQSKEDVGEWTFWNFSVKRVK